MMEEEECRYKALLQPLKDLASNWEVDIAESLSEYVEDLQRIEVSLDGGRSTLNFAQAALLIQGSTAVYSKKVEFLHQLVMQALELMSKNTSEARAGEDKGGRGQAGGGRNAKAKLSALSSLDDERFLFGSDPTYLMLDDYVDEAANIDLNSDAVDAKLREKRRSSGRMPVAAGGDFARSSMVLMHSLMAEDHGGASLKMSSCAMNNSGALLIGGLPPLPSAPSSQRSGGVLFDANDDRMDTDDGDNYQPYYNDGGDDDGDHDEGAYDVGGFVLPEPVAGGAPAAITGKLVRMEVASSSSAADRSVASSSGSSSGGVGAGVLSLMDPHEAVSGSRAVKKGKTYRMPASIIAAEKADKANKAGKGVEEGAKSSSHNTSTLQFTAVSSGLKLIDLLLQEGSHAPELPKGLLHASLFAPLIKAQKKARLAEARKENKGKPRASAYATEFVYQEAAYADYAPQSRSGADLENEDVGGFWGGDDVDDDDNNGGFADYGGGDYFPGDDNAAEDGYADDNTGANPLSEEEELHQRMDKVLDEGFTQAAASSYEVLCRRHIDAFMRGAEQYARETQLSKRVSDWTRRLEPLLRAQEEGPQFDIHDYSDRFLSQVSTLVHRPLPKSKRLEVEDPAIVNFHAVAAGQPASEVCRLFLACLQLANMGNVNVIPPAYKNNCAAIVAPKGRANAKSSKGKKEKDVDPDAMALDAPLSSSSEGWSQDLGFDLRLVNETRRLLDVENVF